MAAAGGAFTKAMRTQRHRLHHAFERKGTWNVLIGVGLVCATIQVATRHQAQQRQPAVAIGGSSGGSGSGVAGMQAWVASAAGAIKKASGLGGGEEEWEWYTKPVPPLKQREDIGAFLEEEGMRVGLELGVQRAEFAEWTLDRWPSCRKYYAVDLWRNQPAEEHYIDGANVPDAEQSAIYYEAKRRLTRFEAERPGMEVLILPMTGKEATRLVPDASLDYIYIDARHDYCGVKEDLHMYWPKLREGGIFAGHDYVSAAEAPGQGWEYCSDGSTHPGAVKGAVNEFAEQRNLTVWSIYVEQQPSWMLRKPERRAKGGEWGPPPAE